jgi:hypothetical protein
MAKWLGILVSIISVNSFLVCVARVLSKVYVNVEPEKTYQSLLFKFPKRKVYPVFILDYFRLYYL